MKATLFHNWVAKWRHLYSGKPHCQRRFGQFSRHNFYTVMTHKKPRDERGALKLLFAILVANATDNLACSVDNITNTINTTDYGTGCINNCSVRANREAR